MGVDNPNKDSIRSAFGCHPKYIARVTIVLSVSIQFECEAHKNGF